MKVYYKCEKTAECWAIRQRLYSPYFRIQIGKTTYADGSNDKKSLVFDLSNEFRQINMPIISKEGEVFGQGGYETGELVKTKWFDSNFNIRTILDYAFVREHYRMSKENSLQESQFYINSKNKSSKEVYMAFTDIPFDKDIQDPMVLQIAKHFRNLEIAHNSTQGLGWVREGLALSSLKNQDDQGSNLIDLLDRNSCMEVQAVIREGSEIYYNRTVLNNLGRVVASKTSYEISEGDYQRAILQLHEEHYL